MAEGTGARIRAAVVDDEPLARGRLIRSLCRHPDIDVVAEAVDGEEAEAMLRGVRPDVVFLDIRMPGADGFDVLRALEPGERPLVVFVTAYGDRAAEAFRVHALDYLMKPFDDPDVDEAVERVRARMASEGRGSAERQLGALLAAEGRTMPFATRVRVQEGERTFFVRVEEIRWIESDGNYVVLHLAETSHRVRTTLAGLLEELDPARFVRIHRSTVLNLDALKEVQPWFSGDYVAVLDDGRELRVSRTYREDLLRSTH